MINSCWNAVISTHGRGRYDDEIRALFSRFLEMSQEGDGLDRFAQPHLVGEDPVDRLLVHQDKPIQTEN